MINGTAGNDTITVTGGVTGEATAFEQVNAYAGEDRIIVDYRALTESVLTGAFWFGSDRQIDLFVGTESNNKHTLDARSTERMTLMTGSGDDVIGTVRNDDIISTGAGSDYVLTRGGGASPDSWLTSGRLRIDTGAGIDLVEADWSDLGVDAPVVLDTTNAAGVTIGTGDAERYLRGVEVLGYFRSGAGDDRLVLQSGAGLEPYPGGSSSAYLGSGVPYQTVYTGAGNDTVTVRGGSGDPAMGIFSVNLDDGADDHLILDMSASLLRLNYGGGGQAFTGSSLFFAMQGAEHVTILGGVAADTLGGNTGNDVIRGDAGDDLLLVSEGVDVVDGGTGSDTLSIDAGRLSESFAQTVPPNGLSFTRRADGGSVPSYDGVFRFGTRETRFTAVERFDITGAYGDDVIATGDGDDRIEGGSGDDRIAGGAGADWLDGQWGADELTGGAGADAFYITQALDGGAPDRIVDFAAADDTIYLDARVFTAFTVDGAIGGSAFRLGITAQTALHRIIYDQTTGTVSYDPDGNGSDAAVEFLILNNRATLTAADFRIRAAAAELTVESVASYTLRWGEANVTLTGAANIDATGLDGANNIVTGNGGNNVLDGRSGADRMVGGSGNDTYYVDDAGDAVIEANGQGSDLVYASVSFVLSANTENLTLSGFTAVDGTGNALANTIIGNAARNRLAGGGGDDTLDGGAGNDAFFVDDDGDRVVERADEGSDTVYALGSYSLSAAAAVETITVYDRDTTNAINLSGNEFAQRIIGNNGVNGLRSGGGADVLYGLGGDDSFVVDGTGAQVIESAGGGYDTVYVSVSHALERGSAVEVFTVYDRGTTNALRLTGNELAQTIYGNAGSNLLDGGGGADVLYGLGGDDAFFVDGLDDQVIEFAGGGADTVYATGSFALGAGSAVETITVYERTTTNALNLAGNELAQRIIGNDGVNSLRSGGGADVLYGLGGDDSFLVDSAEARVLEFAGGGRDTVYATVSYSLGADAAVEVLTAYDRAGTATLNLGGNTVGQTLYGNVGVNFLNGGGGADVLYGLGGDDRFLVDGLDDQVIEFAGGGDDTVYAMGSFALAADAEVETLTVFDRGTANALNLTGSDTANRVIGNDGTNVIDGKGGADTLYGLGGADTFVFSTALGSDNVDEIVGFVSGSDRIQLSPTVFGLPAGGLASGAFVLGNSAGDANDRIIYNQATGALSYDADGSGAGSAVLFATLGAGTVLVAGDLIIV